MPTIRAFGYWRSTLLLLAFCAVSASSFSLDTSNSICWNRRSALANLATVPAVTSLLIISTPATAITASDSIGVKTVVVDSPDSAPRVGIKFIDITLDNSSKQVPSVDKVEPGSIAAANGVQPGMILLGKNSATKSSSVNVDFRMRNGPYPFVLNFATLEEMMAIEAQLATTQQQEQSSNPGSAPRVVDPYGPLKVKKIKPLSCGNSSAKRGDTVTITYEARIGSSTGPLYDSTDRRQGKPATFELGQGFALPGVEIGLNGMCVGEVREIDVPTMLGYGRYGSQVFDIPGDVRLWWRVELLDLARPTGSRSSNWRWK